MELTNFYIKFSSPMLKIGANLSKVINHTKREIINPIALVLKSNEKHYSVSNVGTITNLSLNLTNPVTNITNGLGIFTAMQADSLRIFVHEK